MRRRDFIRIIGSMVSWPLAAYAQQPEQMRRIGVLMNRSEGDPEGQPRLVAFRQALDKLGWKEGRNIRIDIRWGEDKVDLERKYAAELVALEPEVILASGTMSVSALQALSRTLPIVFAAVADPVGAGFVENLARPGGNATGFMAFEFSISGKWLELLKQVAPAVTRVAVLRDPTTTSGIGQFGVIQALAPSLRVEITQVNARDPAEMDRAVAAFAGAPNGGMIVTSSGLMLVHRNLIVELAARHRLPAVYFERRFVADGGLISYDPDQIDQFRQAAGYVDRILKGEKAADLPVQAPTKYELVINLKTAKALGLEVPPTLLGRADEVIE
jgi:putative tryptophan/tyrosine transport system substrate-binding protein